MPTDATSTAAPPACDAALDAADRALCATQAGWLRAVLQWGPLAWLLVLVGWLLWLHNNGPVMWPIALLVLAVAERWYALRLRLDADLFQRLAQGCIAHPAHLQLALAKLGLRAQPPGPPRTLADMAQGCQRLVWRYAACVLALLVTVGTMLLATVI